MDQKILYQNYKKYYQTIDTFTRKPKTKLYTTAVFSFLAIALFGWFAIRPTIQTILYLRRETADKTAVNQAMEEKIASLIQAQAAYQQVEASLPILTNALPTEPHVIEAVTQLRGLANESQATISGLHVPETPLAKKPTPPIAREQSDTSTEPAPLAVTEYPITMSVKGTYEQVKAFVVGLGNLRRIINVESMNIHQSAGTAGVSAGLELNLQLKAYYIK